MSGRVHPFILMLSHGAIYGVKIAQWEDGHELWREELDDPEEELRFRIYKPNGDSSSILANGSRGFWPHAGHLPHLHWLSDHLEGLGLDQSASVLDRTKRWYPPIPSPQFTVEGEELEVMTLLGLPYYLLSNQALQEWAAQRWLNDSA
jgi:hypothetical protein